MSLVLFLYSHILYVHDKVVNKEFGALSDSSSDLCVCLNSLISSLPCLLLITPRVSGGNGLTRGLRLIFPDSARSTGRSRYLFLPLMSSCCANAVSTLAFLWLSRYLCLGRAERACHTLTFLLAWPWPYTFNYPALNLLPWQKKKDSMYQSRLKVYLCNSCLRVIRVNSTALSGALNIASDRCFFIKNKLHNASMFKSSDRGGTQCSDARMITTVQQI